MTQEAETGKRWPEETSALKSPWVRGIIVFMALFLSVNIFMVVTAVNARPDLVTDDYYERGQSFPERSKLKRNLDRERGWELLLDTPEITQGVPATFSLSITADGKAERADEVTLFAYRPSNAKMDFEMPMRKTVDGNYRAELTFGEQGYWDIIAIAKKGGKDTDFAKRIFVKTP